MTHDEFIQTEMMRTSRRFAQLRKEWGVDTPKNREQDESLIDLMYGMKHIPPESSKPWWKFW